MANLNDALNLAQEALERCYWDEEKQYYEHHFPRKEEEAFVYWWHAHTVDALLDGYLRTGDGVYMVPGTPITRPFSTTGMTTWSG